MSSNGNTICYHKIDFVIYAGMGDKIAVPLVLPCNLYASLVWPA